MKIFQGITDGGCEETDECLLLFHHKEIKNIIQVMMQVAGGEWDFKHGQKFTPRQMKAKASKAMKILKDVVY